MTTDERTNRLSEVLGINLKNCEVQLCMAGLTVGSETPDFQRVVLGRELASEFGGIIDGVLGRLRRDIERDALTVQTYEAATKLDDHEIEHLDLSGHKTIARQIAGLADLAGLENFSEDESFVDSLRFYIVVIIRTHKKPIFFFRAYSPKKELGRSKLLAVTMRRGHYDQIKESLFLFDNRIDCFAYGDELFVLNKANFQRIFRFYELLVAAAGETLAVIEKKIPIDNFPAFRLACEGHLQKLAKLKNIASKPYLQAITMKDIRRVIDRYKLNIETVGKGRNEKIQFDASDKWAILRLLDDDYLESLMTGNSYEVNSKRGLKGE